MGLRKEGIPALDLKRYNVLYTYLLLYQKRNYVLRSFNNKNIDFYYLTKIDIYIKIHYIYYVI